MEFGWWVAGRLKGGSGRMAGILEEMTEMEGYVESVGILENG
jgi:hypothetical protein